MNKKQRFISLCFLDVGTLLVGEGGLYFLFWFIAPHRIQREKNPIKPTRSQRAELPNIPSPTNTCFVRHIYNGQNKCLNYSLSLILIYTFAWALLDPIASMSLLIASVAFIRSAYLEVR
jgi:hypothetical protein